MFLNTDKAGNVMEYQCKYTQSPLVIDADLAKPQWEKAYPVLLKGVVSGEKPKQETIAKLLWDENFLYVAFDCEDYEIKAKMTRYNDPIYDEDVVEIFIGDDKNPNSYIEIEVNPNNAILHYLIRNDGKQNFSYERREEVILSAVVRTENKTCYELAIPANEFLDSLKEGLRWRFNLYRIDRGETDEYTAFSPTGIVNYHVPEKFADLFFVK